MRMRLKQGWMPVEATLARRGRGSRLPLFCHVQMVYKSDNVRKRYKLMPNLPSVMNDTIVKRLKTRRDGRVVEGARLESVFRGNSNVGSNPTLSAIILSISL